MCGAIGQLLCLYCSNGCNASKVASALAFHPPACGYFTKYDKSTQRYSFIYADTNESLEGIHLVDRITTTKKKNIVITWIKHKKSRFTILFSHGNATDLGEMMPFFKFLSEGLKVSIVAYDYTGYGDSEGFPSEADTYTDIECAYEWCIAKGVVNSRASVAEQLVLYGQSVGSGPSCYLASKFPIAGMVLHSPIMSGIRVLTPDRTISCLDIYPNLDRISKVNVPVYIMHGLEDEVVGCMHGQELHNNVNVEYRTPPWWVERRGHNDILADNNDEYFRRLHAYLDRVSQNVSDSKLKASHSPSDNSTHSATSASNLMKR